MSDRILKALITTRAQSSGSAEDDLRENLM